MKVRFLDCDGAQLNIGDEVTGIFGAVAEVSGFSMFTRNAEGATLLVVAGGEETRNHAEPFGLLTYRCKDLTLKQAKP